MLSQADLEKSSAIGHQVLFNFHTSNSVIRILVLMEMDRTKNVSIFDVKCTFLISYRLLAFKAEWMTIKDDKLYVGGYGKEWTLNNGSIDEYLGPNPLYIKVGRICCNKK